MNRVLERYIRDDGQGAVVVCRIGPHVSAQGGAAHHVSSRAVAGAYHDPGKECAVGETTVAPLDVEIAVRRQYPADMGDGRITGNRHNGVLEMECAIEGQTIFERFHLGPKTPGMAAGIHDLPP